MVNGETMIHRKIALHSITIPYAQFMFTFDLPALVYLIADGAVIDLTNFIHFLIVKSWHL